ncbi:MAG: helix-turn-helix domain-containing protein [Bacteroidetes bacterium]|nr:helix-turn-helix domain-containing protein [Bacteroidota bacterium]
MSEAGPAVLASRFINNTQRHVFLTGKAGTGKTTFLRNIVANTHKRCVIVAPTGIAAINAGGVTIHSMFQLPFGSYLPVNQPAGTFHDQAKFNDPASLARHMQMNEQKRRLLREMELLIIDEVSMLRADLLDAIDMVLRFVRRNNRSFGGVQVLFIGDLLQLPPVVNDAEWSILRTYYNSIYFFDARCLANDKPIYIELDKIYRQADDQFIQLLNHLRHNQVTASDAELLNRYYKPGFKASPSDNYITLTTHNHKANQMNKDFLRELPGTSMFFEATISGEFSESAYPLEKTLELKPGAQVMFVKNDPTGNQRFFNGRIGKISELKADRIEVSFSDGAKPVVLEKYEWENVRYGLNSATNEVEEIVIGTFSHYPVKLAWSITVHKSQGLTFDKAIVDIGSAFAPGQVYVALSRLRSLAGLVLTSPVNFQGIAPDAKLSDYSNSKPDAGGLETLIESETQHFLKEYLLHSFDLSDTLARLREHQASYHAVDEKKSAKQVHHAWALGLTTDIDAVKIHADKFMAQLSRILETKEDGQLEKLDERLRAAADYFVPVFKKTSAAIFAHIEKVKTAKRMKTYLEELFALENVVYEQGKRIQKAALLTQAILHKREFTRKDLQSALGDAARAAAVEAAMAMPQKGEEAPAEKKPKEKRSRKTASKTETTVQKPGTREETLALFKQGKSIAEIARARQMTEGTIEGHLVFYISQGTIPAHKLVSPAKIEAVAVQIRALDTFRIGPIKEALGDDYSYSDIRLAVAAYLSGK